MRAWDQGMRETANDEPLHVLAADRLPAVALRSVMLTGLFLLALAFTLRLARDFFLPLILAFFLSFLLRPVLRMLNRVHIPDAIGAALLLLAVVGGVGLGVYSLVTPAASWLAK